MNSKRAIISATALLLAMSAGAQWLNVKVGNVTYMKKAIIILLLAVASFNASAEIYSYLKFTKTDGTTLTCSVEGIRLTYDDSYVYINNADGETVIDLSALESMCFSNEGSLQGDVNNDGEVNIADVNAVIEVILSGEDSYAGRADVNGDGEVNIADVNSIIDMILNGY